MRGFFINCFFTFTGLPELTLILNKDKVEELLLYKEQGDSTALKQVFQSLMAIDKAAISLSLQNLLARLETEGNTTFGIFTNVEIQQWTMDFYLKKNITTNNTKILNL